MSGWPAWWPAGRWGGRWVLVGALLVAVATTGVTLVAVGGRPPVPTGLPDPGAVTRWGLPAARLAQDLAGTVVVGLLVLRALAIPVRLRVNPTRLSPPERAAMRWAGVAGLVWFLAGEARYVLTYADLTGTPPTDPLVVSALVGFAQQSFVGRVLAQALAFTLLAAVGALLARGPILAGASTLMALMALVLPTFASHSSSAASHDTAVVAMTLHQGGVAVWVGGLVGLVLLRRALGEHLGTTARAYSTLAGLSYALVAVSGVVTAGIRVPALEDVSTPYLFVLGAKTACFAALGVAGWAHRRGALHRIGGLGDGSGAGSGFARLVSVELLVMGAAIGLAVVLNQVPAST